MAHTISDGTGWRSQQPYHKKRFLESPKQVKNFKNRKSFEVGSIVTKVIPTDEVSNTLILLFGQTNVGSTQLLMASLGLPPRNAEVQTDSATSSRQGAFSSSPTSRQTPHRFATEHPLTCPPVTRQPDVFLMKMSLRRGNKPSGYTTNTNV